LWRSISHGLALQVVPKRPPIKIRVLATNGGSYI
jgi:hypothetical protein